MSRTAPLVITGGILAQLRRLRETAAQNPIDVAALQATITTPEGKVRHKERITKQSLVIPGIWPFLVSFAVETGHPAGTCRHMSMSIQREGRVPSPAAVWIVAEELGFSGGLDHCMTWTEQLEGHGTAVCVIQPVAVQTSTAGRA